MITKTIDLTDRSFLNSGEERVTPFQYTKRHGFEFDDRHSKTAASEEAVEFASHIEPQKGMRIILVSAMGSEDAWGLNKKADVFPEAGLLGKLPKDVPADYYGKFQDKLDNRPWGIQGFITKFDPETGLQLAKTGNTFHEHNNRPPVAGTTADGKGLFGPRGYDVRCGDILAAFWNAIMRRVELIQTVWESKLPHLIKAIDEGFKPGISMACDVPADRCTVCGNLATNDLNYCEHLQRARGLRGKIWTPTGIRIAMRNDIPWLFDSSLVAQPAAVEGRTLWKIASIEAVSNAPAEQLSYQGFQKTYSDELATSNKELEKAAKVAILRTTREPEFPQYVLDAFSELGIVKTANYLGFLGISLKGSEIGKLLFPQSKTAGVSGAIADLVLPQILLKKDFSVADSMSTLLDKDQGLLAKTANELNRPALYGHEMSRVIDVTQPWLLSRSYSPDIMKRREAELPEDAHKASIPRLVNLNIPLSELNDETKAILLTRILSDASIIQSLHDVLVRPVMLWELHKANLAKIAEEHQKQTSPEANTAILADMNKSYMHDLGLARAKFFASQPGNS